MIPAELIPLLDDRFVGSCALFEQYVQRLSIQVAGRLGLEAAAGEPGTAAEIAARAGLDPARAAVPIGWLLSTLALLGCAVRESDGRFRIPRALPDLDPEAILPAQERLEPSALASYRMADVAASLYPSTLRGSSSGEEVLLAPDRIGAWLELGGGLGSGTAACLEHLARTGRLPAVRTYRCTEIAPSFLRRAQRSLAGRFPGVALSFGRLDIDRPFGEAEVDEGAFSLVYGVNTLHVARDLEHTLFEVRRALAPGGALVLSECVRPFPGRPVHVEFLFNLLESFRAPRLVEPWRPNGRFLTPEQWTAALEACGFRDVTFYPDIARIREVCPEFVAAAISAVRA